MTVRRACAGGAAALAVLALAFGAVGCAAPGKPDVVPSDDAAGAAGGVTVQVVDNRYEPATVEISAGEAVTWEFGGSMDHDVVAEDGSFVSELAESGSYTHVFDEPGEYAYDCSVHPEMTGVVRVVE